MEPCYICGESPGKMTYIGQGKWRCADHTDGEILAGSKYEYRKPEPEPVRPAWWGNVPEFCREAWERG